MAGAALDVGAPKENGEGALAVADWGAADPALPKLKDGALGVEGFDSVVAGAPNENGEAAAAALGASS